jgi:hypothetical protein
VGTTAYFLDTVNVGKWSASRHYRHTPTGRTATYNPIENLSNNTLNVRMKYGGTTEDPGIRRRFVSGSVWATVWRLWTCVTVGLDTKRRKEHLSLMSTSHNVTDKHPVLNIFTPYSRSPLHISEDPSLESLRA